jgi:aspartate/methionine/tyrosine aminotransferase
MRVPPKAATFIHMEVGQPATPAPKAARERVRNALETERLGYTDALRLPALRERIARYYQDRYRVSMLPERVVVTAGSSAGFVLVFLAVLDSEDTLLLPSPGYPCYGQILKVLRPEPLHFAAGDLASRGTRGVRRD